MPAQRAGPARDPAMRYRGGLAAEFRDRSAVPVIGSRLGAVHRCRGATLAPAHAVTLSTVVPGVRFGAVRAAARL